MSKNKLRQDMLAKRKQLQKEYVDKASEKITYCFMKKFIKYTSFALYSPILNEVNTLELTKKLCLLDKTVYFPKMCVDEIHLGEIKDISELSRGYKNTLEPENAIMREEVDVIVVPAIAYDTSLFRIGYGKGYYDRFLKRCKCKFKIGFAYSAQIVESVFPEAHDISVDLVITEKEVLYP